MRNKPVEKMHPVGPPGLWRRIAAMIYDSLLVAACCMLVVAIAIGIRAVVVGADTIQAEKEAALGGGITQLLVFLTIYAFFAGFWQTKRQTLGMRAWRLRIDDAGSGGPINFKQGILRYITAWLSFAAVGLGYFWVWIDREKRSWPDLVSGTRLVVLQKQDKDSANPTEQ